MSTSILLQIWYCRFSINSRNIFAIMKINRCKRTTFFGFCLSWTICRITTYNLVFICVNSPSATSWKVWSLSTNQHQSVLKDCAGSKVNKFSGNTERGSNLRASIWRALRSSKRITVSIEDGKPWMISSDNRIKTFKNGFLDRTIFF